jgi:hypothetical protein
MPVRNFAPALKESSPVNPERIAIALQPQDGEDPMLDRTVILELKHGATKDQADALQMQLSLLGSRVYLKEPETQP